MLNRRSICVLLPGLLLACASGCALFSAQPDTPARHVRYRDLNEPVPPGDRYYLLVFGSETTPKLPRFTHSWVTFVHVPPPVPGQPPVIEENTISWMPAKLFIHTLSPCVEPGVNLKMHDSIKMATGYHECVSMWGPFEITVGLYRKLMIQKGFIDSGAIGYQCTDTYGEAGLLGDGSNCIHAISDADSLFTRAEYPLTYFGDAASLHILQELVERGAVAEPYATHDWLIPALHLDCAPITRREYKPPICKGPFRFPKEPVETPKVPVELPKEHIEPGCAKPGCSKPGSGAKPCDQQASPAAAGARPQRAGRAVVEGVAD
jgi:hypothetical protein